MQILSVENSDNHVQFRTGDENGDSGNILSSMDNNNSEIFTAFLKLAIDTDRSERLNEMIKTTGYQLYNTYIGGGAGGNNPTADNWIRPFVPFIRDTVYFDLMLSIVQSFV